MPFINGIGAPELIIILIIALIVVGPGRLPDVGSALGKSIREFRKAATDVKDATSLDDKPQSGPGPDAAAPIAATAVPATAAAAAPAIPTAATAVAPPPQPAAVPETTGATDPAAIEAAATNAPAASGPTAAPDASELPEPVHAEDEQPTPTA